MYITNIKDLLRQPVIGKGSDTMVSDPLGEKYYYSFDAPLKPL